MQPSPTFRGPNGVAWEVPLPEHETSHAQLCQWLIFAPGAHPLWRYHVIVVVHLREMNGQQAKLAFPGASHELMVLAVDPDAEDTIEPEEPETQVPWLMPPDAVVQFIVANDEQARRVARFAAEACTRGLIVPDSDHLRSWQEGIAGTAEHVRLGGHPD